MSSMEVDNERRKFLTTATVVVGGIGAAYGAVPFVNSWKPSAKAQAAGAPIDVDISKMQPGSQIVVEWRKKPVWIIRRTEDSLESLFKIESSLRDPNSAESKQPDYVKNSHRSLNPEYLVLLGVCTHLGCSPKYRPDPGSVSADWLGGFFCPCHGSSFDMAGRVYKGVPAPTNMEIPDYRFASDSVITIGLAPEVA